MAAQPVEGCLTGIHHGDIVALVTQLPGQAGADPPAAHDNRAHVSLKNILGIVSFSAQ
jgi:hypothetical protein